MCERVALVGESERIFGNMSSQDIRRIRATNKKRISRRQRGCLELLIGAKYTHIYQLEVEAKDEI